MDEQNVKTEISTAEATSVSTPVANLTAATKRSSVAIEKLFLPVSILVAAVMISGTLVFTSRGGFGTANGTGQPLATKAPVVDVSVDDDPMLGDPKAKVTIVEFSDFQCPFCRKFFTETFASLKKDYVDTGKARLVFRDFPLQFHPAAQPSAEAAQCAFEQGKFWEFHDKIFLEQGKMGEGTIQYTATELKRWAREMGLNAGQFNECLDSRKYQQEVEKDAADGAAAGVSGTPSFFVNGRILVGAQPYSAFKAAIDAAMSGK